MKFETLTELIECIKNDIMKEDYERYLQMNFGDTEILMFVFENEIPIKIAYHKVYDEEGQKDIICAEVYAELLRTNIGRGWLQELDEICSTIDDNWELFKPLIRKK